MVLLLVVEPVTAYHHDSFSLIQGCLDTRAVQSYKPFDWGITTQVPPCD